jgi:hypothetical protein
MEPGAPDRRALTTGRQRTPPTFIDNRDTLGRILPQVGNIYIVWIADSSDSTGNTNVTDIWTAESVDSTVAIREFSAQQTTGSGAQLQIIPGGAGNLVTPQSL